MFFLRDKPYELAASGGGGFNDAYFTRSNPKKNSRGYSNPSTRHEATDHLFLNYLWMNKNLVTVQNTPENKYLIYF